MEWDRRPGTTTILTDDYCYPTYIKFIDGFILFMFIFVFCIFSVLFLSKGYDVSLLSVHKYRGEGEDEYERILIVGNFDVWEACNSNCGVSLRFVILDFHFHIFMLVYFWCFVHN